MPSTTLDKILDSAHQLLINRGYSGFSYADIAQEVPISKPTIHHHFATKADLGVAVVRRYRENVGNLLRSAGSGRASGRQQLEGYIGYWRECIDRQTSPFCVCAMLAAELPALPQPIQAEVSAHFRELAAWLASVIEMGGRDGSLAQQAAPEQKAAQVMATVHGAMLAARALQSPGEFDMVVRQTVAGLLE
jgi:TetR/AcrR family transcriptional repressor of nem operon